MALNWLAERASRVSGLEPRFYDCERASAQSLKKACA